jgi:hypothetical protein
MIADEHGPDQLYSKFSIMKNSTGKILDPGVEFFFVLRPETNDKAALAALRTYAEHCAVPYPQLAKEIIEQVERIERDFPDGNPAARMNGK